MADRPRRQLTERDIERMLDQMGREERERPLSDEDAAVLERVKVAVLGEDGEP